MCAAPEPLDAAPGPPAAVKPAAVARSGPRLLRGRGRARAFELRELRNWLASDCVQKQHVVPTPTNVARVRTLGPTFAQRGVLLLRDPRASALSLGNSANLCPVLRAHRRFDASRDS